MYERFLIGITQKPLENIKIFTLRVDEKTYVVLTSISKERTTAKQYQR